MVEELNLAEAAIHADAASACLSENPNGLMSLLDVLRFYAEKVARSSSLLGQIFVEIRSGIMPKDSSFGIVGSELRELEALCAEMGLSVTLAQINRVNQMVHDDSFGRNLMFFGQQLIEIQTRLNDELAGHVLYRCEQCRLSGSLHAQAECHAESRGGSVESCIYPVPQH